ncbi:MAG: UDP-3-O-(3-hydroxymyristoyl)glucosamine N-acyltransferase [Oligoflexus sp.]
MRLDKIVQITGAKLHVKDPAQAATVEINGLGPIEHAGPGSLSFIASSEYEKFLETTQASAVIVKQLMPDCQLPQLIHKNPYLAFAKVALQFYQPKHDFQGISPQAFIAEDADVSPEATIFPFAYVGSKAKIGRGVVLYPGVYVGAEAVIDDDSVLYANVVVGERCQLGKRLIIHGGCVIGADGFGFAKGEDEIVKIPQTGIVVIEDDVEMGACCTVDRATMGETRVKRMTKFDSRVHIAHNVQVGEFCLFSAQTGVAGSTKIGNWVTTGGNAGFSGHIEVKDGVTFGAKTGVIHNIGPGGTYMGFPAIPAQQWRKQQVYFKRLPDYDKRVKELEKRLAALEKAEQEKNS